MKATGIVRRIDDLGRVVIPKEIRRTMRIREGDPLEIYTDKDGEVIFKKYSPVGEISSFATQLCETMAKTTGHSVAITDRDTVIAASGGFKRDLYEKKLTEKIEKMMEERQVYQYKQGDNKIAVSENVDKCFTGIFYPVIVEGDVTGGVIFAIGEGEVLGESEAKLAQTVAGFISRQMES
jgi:AbrB family transcriptional regulator (stage V sporulation protein T)